MKKLITSLAILLTGCSGYTALYQDAGETIDQVVVGQVSMREIERNVGQRRVAQLVSQNLRKMFMASDGKYDLKIIIEESTSSLAVQRDATDLRLQLSLQAETFLVDQNGKEIYKDFISSSASYNVEDSPFGTDAGRDFARSAAAQKLSDEITYKIAIFLRQHAEE